jgi:hypothetical protein
VTRTIPLDLADANDLVSRLHRHHKPVTGHRFSIGLEIDGQLIGACIVGRPVARGCDQKATAEVTRLVTDGTFNACSKLYSAAARAARAMGYDSIQTYILNDEPVTSLLASGWTFDHVTAGGLWDTPSRPRDDKHPTMVKQCWVKRFRP